MQKTIKTVLGLALVIIVCAFSVKASYAATLKFDPTSITATSGNTFEVDIIVDAEDEEISGTDAYILYDSTLVDPKDVTPGTFFPVVSNTTDGEQVYINGVVTDPTDFKTGSGVLATVTFEMLTGGSGDLQFYCDTTQPDTSKIVKNDVDATNVIDCASLTAFQINGGDAPADVAPTATPMPAPTSDTSGGIKQTAQTVQPTALPESGVFDNVVTFAVPGVVMVVVGVILKFVI
ncbi:MAG: cohesin domain-containing protein [Patescibacteria group bacterium]